MSFDHIEDSDQPLKNQIIGYYCKISVDVCNLSESIRNKHTNEVRELDLKIRKDLIHLINIACLNKQFKSGVFELGIKYRNGKIITKPVGNKFISKANDTIFVWDKVSSELVNTKLLTLVGE